VQVRHPVAAVGAAQVLASSAKRRECGQHQDSDAPLLARLRHLCLEVGALNRDLERFLRIGGILGPHLNLANLLPGDCTRQRHPQARCFHTPRVTSGL
jgi:hypothetical protein